MSRDELEITVAVLGPPFRPFIVAPDALSVETTGPAVAYAERPKVTLVVAPNETLGSALTQAAVQFGFREMTAEEAAAQWGKGTPVFPLSEIIRFVDFYRPGDSVEAHHEPILGELTGVDSEGVAYRRRWQDCPFEDLIRSRDEGLLPGDPLRLYLVPYPPGGGDVWITTWDALRASLDGIWWILDKVGILGGAWGAYEVARRRVKAARSAIAENASHWSERGIDPADMDLILNTRAEWRPSNVAALFDCTEEQAEGVLVARGWRYDEARAVWRPATGFRSRVAEAAAAQPLARDEAQPIPGQRKAALDLASRSLAILFAGPRRWLGARRYTWHLWLGERGFGPFADPLDDEDDESVNGDAH